ncbi:hypothetical protein ACLOJK_030397 [Asimina triloba]
MGTCVYFSKENNTATFLKEIQGVGSGSSLLFFAPQQQHALSPVSFIVLDCHFREFLKANSRLTFFSCSGSFLHASLNRLLVSPKVDDWVPLHLAIAKNAYELQGRVGRLWRLSTRANKSPPSVVVSLPRLRLREFPRAPIPDWSARVRSARGKYATGEMAPLRNLVLTTATSDPPRPQQSAAGGLRKFSSVSSTSVLSRSGKHEWSGFVSSGGVDGGDFTVVIGSYPSWDENALAGENKRLSQQPTVSGETSPSKQAPAARACLRWDMSNRPEKWMLPASPSTRMVFPATNPYSCRGMEGVLAIGRAALGCDWDGSIRRIYG